MQRKWKALLVVCLAVLSACSGNDASPPPPAPAPATSAEGLWTGTTNTGRIIGGLALDDGTYWFLYTVIGNPSVVAGLVQGNYTSQNGSFTSSNTKDFNLEGSGIQNATIAGNYVQKQSLNGTIAYQGGGTGTFTAAYDPEYELTPNINLVAGTFTGLVANNETVTVIVSGAGSISGSSTSGCTFTGTASPRSSGNAFNVTVTFGGAPCINGADTVNGVAYFDAATKRLYSAALNSTRTNGFLYIGTKP